MALTESLTVRILGDSSQLQEELSRAAQGLDDLQTRFSGVNEAGRGIADSFGDVDSAMQPLQQLGVQLARTTQLVRQLSGQTITLNVQPALQALAQLMQAAQSAARQLQSLSMGPRVGMGAAMPAAAMGPMPVRGFASGGLVTGPAGVDQVPAWLSEGEYVLSRNAVAMLGVSLLDRMNAAPPMRTTPIPSNNSEPRGLSQTLRSIPSAGESVAHWTPPLLERVPLQNSASSGPSTKNSRPMHPPIAAPLGDQQTNNHFGGIEIHVRETADVDELMQSLRRQGITLRNRRG